MKLSVKPLNIDSEEKNYVYKTRTAKIKVSSSNSIKTPIRAINNSEMRAKQQAPADIAISSEIGGVITKFTIGNTRNIEKFITDNHAYANIQNQINTHLRLMDYFQLKYALLQPGAPAIKWLHENNKIGKFLRMQKHLQAVDIEVPDFNIITIPWLDLSAEDFIEVHESYMNSCPEKEIIPFIDPNCKSEVLSKILEHLVSYEETGDFNVLGIIHRSFKQHLANYDMIWENFYDKNIGIFLTDITRVNHGTDVSGVHFSEFVLGDVFTSWVPVVGFNSNNDTEKGKKPKSIEEQLKFFDRSNLTVSKIQDLMSNKNWVDDIITQIGEKSLRDPIEHYYEAEQEPVKKNILGYISKVHEFKTSREEFLNSQDYIKQNESLAYIKEKGTFGNNLKSI